MGTIIMGLASSHAYAFLEPTEWDSRRETSRTRYKDRYGVEPPIHPKVAEETLEKREAGYTHVRDAFDFLKEKLKQKHPDVLILIGDDQDENFKEDNVPQISIYLGDEVFATERRQGTRQRFASYHCDSNLA